ncbi:MAG: hypothetical protein KDC67_07605 [Ignavibacteriae bacterium]|nr:hypothetical protein [Ignavibacteriota bacterium]
MSKVLTIGSIAYDRIFTIDGAVEDGIILKDGQIKNLDLTFRADDPIIQFGGTGGNIAYGLGLLGVEATLIGSVGKDFHFDYAKKLKNLNIGVDVHTKEDGHTATFYGIEDKNHKTISIWQPNVSSMVEEIEIKEVFSSSAEDVRYVIVSAPGKPVGFEKFLRESKDLFPNAKLIFDPGQDLSFMSKDMITNCIELCDIIITNDVEIDQLTKATKMEIENMIDKIEMLVVTKGEDGVTAYLENGTEINVPACKIDEIVQVTGAGDAFRAGLLYGLSNEETLEKSLQFGSVLGSFAVEAMGGQGYEVTKEEFTNRFKENYED